MALVLAAPCAEPERHLLMRLVELGGRLLASHEREEALRAELMRLRRERLRLEERLGQREEGQARVAHDLRTPLMVLQGYLEMMNKGMGGPLTPALQRYVDRMNRSVGELGTRLQQRASSAESVLAEELRPLLCATFSPEQGARIPVQLELPEEPVLIRSARPELLLLARTLSRLLAGTQAQGAVLRVDAAEGSELWRLHLRAWTEHPAPERPLRLLEQLTRRLEGTLSVAQKAPRFELLLHLPRVAAPSTAK
jgi:signal transduction histidine kinase